MNRKHLVDAIAIKAETASLYDDAQTLYVEANETLSDAYRSWCECLDYVAAVRRNENHPIARRFARLAGECKRDERDYHRLADKLAIAADEFSELALSVHDAMPHGGPRARRYA